MCKAVMLNGQFWSDYCVSIIMKKILVINNHKDTMESIQKYLKRNDFKAEYIFRAEDTDVIKKVDMYEPDLILLEGSVGPEGELCKRINRNKKVRIPIILMAGHISTEIPHESCDVDDIISKPIQPKLLLEKIDNLVRTA